MKPSNSKFGASSAIVRKRSWLAIGVLLAAIISVPFSLIAASRVLKSNLNKVEDWLPASYPETKTHFWFQEHFKGDEVLIVSWVGCNIDDKRLDTLRENALKSTDREGRPLFRRVWTTKHLYDKLTSGRNGLKPEAAKERLKGWMLSSDGVGACAILMVDSTMIPDRHRALSECHRIATDVCDISAEDLRIGGPTADSVFIDRVSANSLYILSSIAGIVGIVLAWIFLRSWILTTATFTTALLAQLYILVAIYWSNQNMDAVLTMVPLLVYVLTICASIHFLSAYREACEHSKAPEWEALRVAWKPTTLAAITTAMGLISMVVSDLRPIQKFGFFGAIGVIISLPVLFIYQTAFLECFAPGGVTVDSRHHSNKNRFRIDLTLARFAIKHSTAILIICFVASAVLLAGALQLKASAKIRDMFTQDSKELDDYRWLEHHVAPLVPIDIVLRFDDQSELTMLDRATIVERIRRLLTSIESVHGSTAATSFLPDFHESQGIRGVAKRAVANTKLKGSRANLIDEGLLADAPTEELWLIMARLSVFEDIDYSEILTDIQTAVDSELVRVNAEVTSPIHATITGGVPAITSIQKRLLVDLNSSLAASIAMIGGLLAIGLRSISSGVLLLIPNIFPVILIFGIIGWAGGHIDLGSMLTISTAIGIAVDNELHFIARYRQLLLAGESSASALMNTLEHCGPAIMHSAIICGAGMVVLMFSAFLPTVRFGSILALLMVAAVFGDLVLLPAILSSPLGRSFSVKPKLKAAVG